MDGLPLLRGEPDERIERYSPSETSGAFPRGNSRHGEMSAEQGDLADIIAYGSNVYEDGVDDHDEKPEFSRPHFRVCQLELSFQVGADVDVD